jgi:hypothetical protein
MSKKQAESAGMGAGGVVFFLAVLAWLVVTYPWLLLFPIAFWLFFIRPNRRENVRRRPPPPAVIHAPAPRIIVATPPRRTMTPAPPPKAIPQPAKTATPDFIPKDREYNKYLARTWDEEFEALIKEREQFPPS